MSLLLVFCQDVAWYQTDEKQLQLVENGRYFQDGISNCIFLTKNLNENIPERNLIQWIFSEKTSQNCRSYELVSHDRKMN